MIRGTQAAFRTTNSSVSYNITNDIDACRWAVMWESYAKLQKRRIHVQTYIYTGIRAHIYAEIRPAARVHGPIYLECLRAAGAGGFIAVVS